VDKDEQQRNLPIEMMYSRANDLEHSGRLAEALNAFMRVYEANMAFRDVARRIERLQLKISHLNDPPGLPPSNAITRQST